MENTAPVSVVVHADMCMSRLPYRQRSMSSFHIYALPTSWWAKMHLVLFLMDTIVSQLHGYVND
jgi:hypothetical protein